MSRRDENDSGEDEPVVGEEEVSSTVEQAETFSISELEAEKMRHESEDYKDKYFRVLAESENARKRLIKEKQDMIQYSTQNLICDFLVPIDQMENALKHTGKMSEEVKQWSIGFGMILSHFRDVLVNNNVQAYESIGKTFDPHFHEAVEMVESKDYPPGTVVEECLRGYKIGTRVIRPARVKVAKESDTNSDE